MFINVLNTMPSKIGLLLTAAAAAEPRHGVRIESAILSFIPAIVTALDFRQENQLSLCCLVTWLFGMWLDSWSMRFADKMVARATARVSKKRQPRFSSPFFLTSLLDSSTSTAPYYRPLGIHSLAKVFCNKTHKTVNSTKAFILSS